MDTSKFDGYFAMVKARDARSTAARLTLDPVQPQQAAEGVAIGKELGVPAGQVMAAPQMFKDRLAQERAAKALTDAPKMSDWLRSDPVGAALAKDDLPNLSWWERDLRDFAAMGKPVADAAGYGANAAKRGTLGLQQGAAQGMVGRLNRSAADRNASFGDIVQDARTPVMVDGKEVARQWAGPGTLGEALYRYSASRASMLLGGNDEAAAIEMQTAAGAISKRVAETPMSPGAAAARDRIGKIDGNAPMMDQVSAFGQAIAEDPAGFSAFITQIGMESLPSMVAGGVVGAVSRSPAAAATTMGVMSGTREYGSTVAEELTRAGHDLSTPEGAAAALRDPKVLQAAQDKGEMRALIVATFDGLAAGLAGQQMARSPLGNMVLQGLAQAASGAAGEALGQVTTEGRITNVSDILLEAMAELATAPAEVASMGASRLMKDKAAVDGAGQTARILDEVSTQAQASQLRARSPEAFQSALDSAGVGDQSIYLPAADLREFFQAKDTDFNPEDWGIDPQTFAEIEIIGGRVAMPMSEFAAKVAGIDAEFEGWVRQNASMDPDELSLGEAASFADLVPADLSDAYERELQDMRDDDARKASDVQVYDSIYSQLRGAGRTVDVAQREAEVMTAFFRTQADRMGDDALDLARRFNLDIRGPDTAEAPRRRNQLDLMLNDLRVGKKEKLGLSLTEFVISEGGVQDTGGDVEALEVKGLVGESAKDIRARHIEPTLPGIAPVLGKGLQLDELGRMAVEAGYFPELMGEVQGLNAGEAADLGAALLEALRDEASGNKRYRPGDGPDPARAALVEDLGRRGLDPTSMSNDEIAAALEVREFEQSAIPDGAEKLWRHGLQRVFSGAAKAIDMVSMGRPGAILRTVGVSDAPLTMNSGKLRKVMRDHPEVSEEVAVRLVSGINDPEFILRSATESDSVVVVPVQLPDGRVFIVPIHKDTSDRQGRKINLIASAYIKNDPDWIGREIASGRLLYAREKRSAAVRANVAGSNPRHGQPNSAGRNSPRSSKVIYRTDIFKSRSFDQQRRGSILFPQAGPDGATTIINLFQSADLSTFLHEGAHFFLEAQAALAADPAAPQQMRDDMAEIRAYLGADEGQPFTVDQHETWARSFEAYMMEGKAPSFALGDAFARARAWLTRIYRSIAGLDVKITPSVREVMDRMLATDAEIAAVREEVAAGPLFRERPPGMSDTDWATYQRMARRSAEHAEAKLMEKTMAAVRRRTEKWWKTERAEVRAQVEADINAKPQHRLIEAMANGRFMAEDGERAAPDMRISRKLLVEQFGDGVLAELSRTRLGGKRAIYGDEGISPQAAADMFGFASPAAMIEVLQNTGKRVEAIDTETDRIMLDRYGDPFTDGSIEQEALDAIHNDQTQQKHVAEARLMATRIGRDTRNMTSRVYRQRARMMLGRMTVREATASARFLAAERKAGRTAERAFAAVARGDASRLAEALQAKEQQILNAAIYDLSRQADADVARARGKFQDYGKKTVRAKLEGGYIEQIDAILDRFDFRKRGPGAVARSESLRDFIQRMKDDGREADLAIDDRLLDEARRVHYSRLSLDDLHGLIDTVANLDHLGRFKQKLINARRQRELNETAEAVADAIEKNVGTGKAKKESRLRSILDLILTTDAVLNEVDGGDEFGAAYQAIKEDIDGAHVTLDEMNKELADKLSDLFSGYSAKEISNMKTERHVSGTRFMWTKWQAISAALNTGNEDNIARLLSEDAHPDQRMTREDLDAVLAALDKRDWNFVQSTWDLINSYWPQLEAVTQRRTGVKPRKVEAVPVQTKFGTYAGGYYPIKYDPGLGHAALMDARSEMDKFMSAGRSGKAQTKSGHTKERKKTGNGRALMLDMNVAFTHLRDVQRDIALSEAVDNAYRVLNHPRTSQAFIDAGRANDMSMLNLWLKDVAQGPIVHSDELNLFARIVKNNFTLSRLAFNLKTVMLQTTGLAQSAVVVGKGNMARAATDYFRRPREMSREVMQKSAFMRRRETTMNKDIQDFASDTMISSPLASRTGKAMDKIGKLGFLPLVKMQFYSVDMPTWLAGYRSGLRRFGTDEGRAVAFADRMVARAQDSGAMPDRTAISRGTLNENVRQVEWVKLFTTLQGYMLAKLSRAHVRGKQAGRDVRAADNIPDKTAAVASAAVDMALLYMAEAVMMGAVYAVAQAFDDDDDFDGEKFLSWTVGETLGAVAGGVPLVRDAWTLIDKPYATSGGVYGSITEIPANLYQQTFEQAFENDRGLRRAIADAIGTATGLPTTASLRPIEALLSDDGFSPFEALMGSNPLTR